MYGSPGSCFQFWARVPTQSAPHTWTFRYLGNEPYHWISSISLPLFGSYIEKKNKKSLKEKDKEISWAVSCVQSPLWHCKLSHHLQHQCLNIVVHIWATGVALLVQFTVHASGKAREDGPKVKLTHYYGKDRWVLKLTHYHGKDRWVPGSCFRLMHCWLLHPTG